MDYNNKLLKCSGCGTEWETNYCPICRRTIDRTIIQKEPKAQIIKVANMEAPVSVRLKREHSIKVTSKNQLSRTLAETKDKLKEMLLIGIGLTVLGLVITIGSYMIATKIGEGRYIVPYGLVFVGILLIIRCFIGFAKIGKIENEIMKDESKR